MTVEQLLWCDSHCHFDFAVFDNDREAHWQWLQQLGLRALVIPGVSRSQGAKLASLCANKPWFYAQGLHPYFIGQHKPSDLLWLEQQLQQDAHIIAVGEIGLDKVIVTNNDDLTKQLHFFTAQAQLAKRFAKPLILHVRGKHDEAWSVLQRMGFDCGGVVHAFSGSMQQAKKWLDLGFKLGVGGAMTHSRAIKLRRTIDSLPLSAWLLETDSPDMKSAFWRDEAHSPAAIPLLANCLAAIKKCNLADIAIAQQQEIRTIWPAINQAFQCI